MVTSAPAGAFSADPKFLTYIDRDGNKRIRTDDINAAVDWLYSAVIPEADVISEKAEASLNEFRKDTDLGRSLYGIAGRFLKTKENSGGTDAAGKRVTVQQVAELIAEKERAFSLDEDGEGLGEVFRMEKALLDTYGLASLTKNTVEKFAEEAASFIQWKKHKPPLTETAERLLSEDDIFAIYSEVKPLLDDFFFACAALEFGVPYEPEKPDAESAGPETPESDPRAAVTTRLNGQFAAVPNRRGELSLKEGNINPLYAETIFAFRERALPLLAPGREQYGFLSSKEWAAVKKKAAPYESWKNSRPETRVSQLPLTDLELWVETGVPGRLARIMEDKEEQKSSWSALRDLEKCLLYKKWLFPLVNNFVALRDLGSKTSRCLFEAGFLIIDGRQFNLSLLIRDIAAHKRLSAGSGLFIVYCGISDREEDETFFLASPVTSGESRYLHKGKRGIFFDLAGKEWDVEILDILENPISLKEILIKPFKAAAGAFERQMNKRQQIGSEKMEQNVEEHTVARPPAQTTPGTGLRDILLVGGIGIAALGSAFAFITRTMSEVRPIIIISVFGGLIAAVLIPAVIIGIIKLRRCDLTVILEAEDWAVNSRIQLTRRIRRRFTFTPKRRAKRPVTNR